MRKQTKTTTHLPLLMPGGFGWLVGIMSFWLLVNSGYALADYVKVSNNGQALDSTATLGSGANDWGCTFDTNTNLMWEVKTSDGGLRDKSWKYKLYDPNITIYNDYPSGSKGAICFESDRNNCKTNIFVNKVNSAGLCGSSDWRMPAINEIKELVYCSNGIPPTDKGCSGAYTKPVINTSYFPDIVNNISDYYWSSTISNPGSPTG